MRNDNLRNMATTLGTTLRGCPECQALGLGDIGRCAWNSDRGSMGLGPFPLGFAREEPPSLHSPHEILQCRTAEGPRAAGESHSEPE